MTDAAHEEVLQLVAAAQHAAVPLDIRAVRERIEAAGGGLEVAHTAAGLEVRVEVLNSPGPGTVRVERGDVLYVVLDGSGVLGVENSDPLELRSGGAAVVTAGATHVVFGNPRLSLLVVSAPSWTTPVGPLAFCRRA